MKFMRASMVAGTALLVTVILAAAPARAAAPMGPLPGLTDAEANADVVWRLRSGLNVAALQCQFSPFLRAVPVYNAFLRQHSDELASSFNSMVRYFVRNNGQRAGQRAFDTYATRASQDWATFDAKLGFCEAAAMVGRRALAIPKGQFAEFARLEVPRLQQSLTPRAVPEALTLHLIWPRMPDMSSCKKGKRCPY